MVKYENGRLLIGIPTAAPEELHQAIIQSVIQNLKVSSVSTEPVPDNAKECNYWMLELLENMLPSTIENTKT